MGASAASRCGACRSSRGFVVRWVFLSVFSLIVWGVLMRSYSKLILTSWLGSGTIQGQPGDEIAVTDENRAAAAELVKERGCRVVFDAEEAGPSGAVASVDGVDGDSDAEDGDGLTEFHDADSVDVLDIAPRYVQALRDAGLKTIGDVKAFGDLLAVPGITAAAAKKIATELLE